MRASSFALIAALLSSTIAIATPFPTEMPDSDIVAATSNCPKPTEMPDSDIVPSACKPAEGPSGSGAG